ncbi:angiotensin-converting enzyme-like [Planococcus citri]|uniref:angiotensin-converting enzyme-like n=1 Tax=Planococcus citri TaxID=170843 RepID=UPI0031F9DA33
MFGVLTNIVLVLSSCRVILGDRGYIPSDDRDQGYIDPNTYIRNNAQNQHVQEVLRKYSQDGRYSSSANPLTAINKELTLSTPDPRYYDASAKPSDPRFYDTSSSRPLDPNYRSRPYGSATGVGDERIDINNIGLPGSRYRDPNYGNRGSGSAGYGTDRDRDRFRNRYDVYSDNNGGRGDPPPRQYFGNDPQYALREDEIFKILAQIDVSASQQCNINVKTQWDFETNVNDASQIRALEQQLAYSEFQRRVHNIAEKIDKWDIRDLELLRQLRYLSVVGPSVLPPDQLNRYNRLINDMLAIYNTATVCDQEDPLKCGLRLEDLNVIMARSRDWDELQHVWIEWHRKTGQQIRELYVQLVDLSNYAAQLNNFTDTSEYWMFPFEMYDFRNEMERVWDQIRPLYEQLHAYVRRKLRDLYGPEKISREAPLPAHILGNMWGQSWENILDVTIPYPGKNFLDVTPEMLKQGYTPEAMYRVAEEFFVSMNMSAMPPEFWSKSVFEEVPGRPVICQPSAWDFCNGIDYRIKMCTRITMKDFVTVHHEMAHIQYFLHYGKLPKVYRDGANPGFHEAISEAISLSVSNPKHMQTLGLVLTSVDDVPHNINFLFHLAMDKLTFLPFSLALDMWRWDIFSGYTRKERYNCHWWDLRERLSGVKPPVLRSEIDFDPGSKYHVPANIPYVGYYFGTVLEFQIFRALCKAAGQYVENDARKPLHKCDIYRSREAGSILRRLMESGSSLPWQETLRLAIGENRLDASAVRDYFKPLEEWLRNENLRTGEFVGWVYDGDYCKYSIETANLQVYGGFYNNSNVLSFSLSLLFISCLTVILSHTRWWRHPL